MLAGEGYGKNVLARRSLSGVGRWRKERTFIHLELVKEGDCKLFRRVARSHFPGLLLSPVCDGILLCLPVKPERFHDVISVCILGLCAGGTRIVLIIILHDRLSPSFTRL